jgi:hypothetical protein
LKPPERAAALKETCRCFAGRVGADKKLATYLGSKDKVVNSEASDEQLQSYIALLAQASLFSCLLPRVETALSAMELPAK